MPLKIRISAVVSSKTREALEKLVRATGLKKGHVVEEALLCHLRAMAELPADDPVPPVVTLTRGSGGRLLAALHRAAKPTAALRRLMSPQEDQGDCAVPSSS